MSASLLLLIGIAWKVRKQSTVESYLSAFEELASFLTL